MPDFAAIAGLLGNVKGVFDFVAGTTGSLAGFDGTTTKPGPVQFFEMLFSGSSAPTEA